MSAAEGMKPIAIESELNALPLSDSHMQPCDSFRSIDLRKEIFIMLTRRGSIRTLKNLPLCHNLLSDFII